MPGCCGARYLRPAIPALMALCPVHACPAPSCHLPAHAPERCPDPMEACLQKSRNVLSLQNRTGLWRFLDNPRRCPPPPPRTHTHTNHTTPHHMPHWRRCPSTIWTFGPSRLPPTWRWCTPASPPTPSHLGTAPSPCACWGTTVRSSTAAWRHTQRAARLVSACHQPCQQPTSASPLCAWKRGCASLCCASERVM